MKIVLGAAKGLAFLHSPKIKVIYRDYKPSNILLDSVCQSPVHYFSKLNTFKSFLALLNSLNIYVIQDFDAKLSDFGLAKDGPCDDQGYVSTRVMGTQGYAAPEYVATGKRRLPQLLSLVSLVDYLWFLTFWLSIKVILGF